MVSHYSIKLNHKSAFAECHPMPIVFRNGTASYKVGYIGCYSGEIGEEALPETRSV